MAKHRVSDAPVTYKSVSTATVTIGLAANFRRKFWAIYNETGSDVYYVASKTAPTDSNGMVLLADGDSVEDSGFDVAVSTIYLLQSSGGTLNVKIVEGA